MTSKDDDTLPLPGFSQDFSIDNTLDEDFIPTSQPQGVSDSKTSKTPEVSFNQSIDDSQFPNIIPDSRIEDTLPPEAVLEPSGVDVDKSTDFILDTETKQTKISYVNEDVSCKKKLPVSGPEIESNSLWDKDVSKIPESPLLGTQDYSILRDSPLKSAKEMSITEIIVNDSAETVDLETTPIKLEKTKSESAFRKVEVSYVHSDAERDEETQIFENSSIVVLDTEENERACSVNSEQLYLQATVEDPKATSQISNGLSPYTEAKTNGNPYAEENLPNDSGGTAKPLANGNSFPKTFPEITTNPSSIITRKVEWKLSVTCLVTINTDTNKITQKMITGVSEIHKPKPKPVHIEPNFDTLSDKKRYSTSSSGSVYSDKNGLPFALPKRISLISDLTDSSEEDFGSHLKQERRSLERTPWSNEYLFPLKMDDILQTYMENQEYLKRPNVVSPQKYRPKRYELKEILEKSSSERTPACDSISDDPPKLTNGSFTTENPQQIISGSFTTDEQPKVSNGSLTTLEKDTPELHSSEDNQNHQSNEVQNEESDSPEKSPKPNDALGKILETDEEFEALANEKEKQVEEEQPTPVEVTKEKSSVESSHIPETAFAEVTEKLETIPTKLNDRAERGSNMESENMPVDVPEKTEIVPSEVIDKAEADLVEALEKPKNLPPEVINPPETNSSDINKESDCPPPVIAKETEMESISTTECPEPISVEVPKKAETTPVKVPTELNTIPEEPTKDTAQEKAIEQIESTKIDGSNAEEENNSSVQLSDGVCVFARWTDKRYYPGILCGSPKNDRWEIKFDDGTSKIVREDFILPADWLKVGALVFALYDDKYESGQVRTVKKGEEVSYVVELDTEKKDIDVKMSDLCLTDVMAGIIKEKYRPLIGTPRTTADIDFDNVLSGKRLREQRTPLRSLKDTPSGSSSTNKKSSSKAKKIDKSNLESIKETPSAHDKNQRGLKTENGHLVEDRVISTDSPSGNETGETPLRKSAKEPKGKAKPRSLSYEAEETRGSRKKSKTWISQDGTPIPGPSGVISKKQKTKATELESKTPSGEAKSSAPDSSEKTRRKRKMDEVGDENVQKKPLKEIRRVKTRSKKE